MLRSSGAAEGEMAPMEVDSGSSTAPRAVSQSSSTRVGLLLCLTVVPIAFFAAGLSLTFPAAELEYEVEASVPSSGRGSSDEKKEMSPPSPSQRTSASLFAVIP